MMNNNMKMYRTIHNISQAKLGRMMGISQGMISAIEINSLIATEEQLQSIKLHLKFPGHIEDLLMPYDEERVTG